MGKSYEKHRAKHPDLDALFATSYHDHDRPDCDITDLDAGLCDHDGWKHAETAEEIFEAIKKGYMVYDEDGDAITEMDYGHCLGQQWCIHYGTGSSTYELDRESYILISLPPVTEEELDEVYQILGADHEVPSG